MTYKFKTSDQEVVATGVFAQPHERTRARGSTVDAASAFHTRGWCLVALAAGEKRPVHSNWQDRAYTPDELPLYFADGKNLGLVLGERSGGLMDVDIDSPYALGPARKWLPETAMRHGRASKQDSHYWYVDAISCGKTQQFKAPDGATLIELRATGGQTAVPPSVHPSGEPLIWHSEGEPAELAREALEPVVAKIAAAALLAKHWPQEGSRNNAALALSGVLLRGGMTVEEAEDFIVTLAEAAGDEEVSMRAATVATTRENLDLKRPVTGIPKLKELIGEREVDQAIQWLQLAHVISCAPDWDEPILFEAVSPPDIPAHLLPGPAGAFAKALAAETETPEALATLTVLGVASTCLATRFVVRPKDNWKEPVNIYAAVALPPGNNKSQVMKRCIKPLVHWESQERGKTGARIRFALSQRKTDERRLEGLRQKAAKEDDNAKREKLEAEILELEFNLPEIPVLPQLFANNLTPEALVNAVAEQGGRFAVLSDEGGVFETLAGLYTNGVANVDVLLKGIDGGDLRIKRKDQQFEVKPFLTLVLAIQPQILNNMAEKRAFQGNGLTERFLFALPPSKLGHRTLDGPPVDPLVEERYGELITGLLDIQRARVDGDTEGPHVLTLSTAAEAAWTQFRVELEPELRPEGRLCDISGWVAKLPGFTLRMAALLHVMDKGTASLEIELATIEAAMTLARLLIEHNLAVRDLIGADEATGDARALLEWILKAQRREFTQTECLQAHRSRLKTAKRKEAALRLLIERNIIREVGKDEAGQRRGPGRPTSRYRVNPRLWEAKDARRGLN